MVSAFSGPLAQEMLQNFQPRACTWTCLHPLPQPAKGCKRNFFCILMASCNRLQGLAISLRREKSLMLSDFKVRCIILNRCGQNKPHPHHGIAGGRSSTICVLIYIPAVVDKINKMAPVCCCDRGTTSPRCDICVSSRMKALLQKACASVWGTPRLFIFGKPFVSRPFLLGKPSSLLGKLGQPQNGYPPVISDFFGCCFQGCFMLRFTILLA